MRTDQCAVIVSSLESLLGMYVTMQREKDGSCFSASSEMRIARCADGPTWNTATLAWVDPIPNILRVGGPAEELVGCF